MYGIQAQKGGKEPSNEPPNDANQPGDDASNEPANDANRPGNDPPNVGNGPPNAGNDAAANQSVGGAVLEKEVDDTEPSGCGCTP